MKTLIMAVGLVMIIEGIPYFTMPGQVKEVAEMITGANTRSLRYVGLGLMLGGLAIVALVKL